MSADNSNLPELTDEQWASTWSDCLRSQRRSVRFTG